MFQQQTSDISQLSSGSIYFPVEGGWKFWLCGRNPTVCHNLNYWAVLSCGTVYYAVQGGSNFWVCGWNPMVWPTIQMTATEQYFPVVLFIFL